MGKGIGLEVHERPRLSAAMNPDLILPGSLFTVEPGLYYPSRGLGVPIEDVIYAHHDGSFENLTHVPYELEIAPASRARHPRRPRDPTPRRPRRPVRDRAAPP